MLVGVKLTFRRGQEFGGEAGVEIMKPAHWSPRQRSLTLNAREERRCDSYQTTVEQAEHAADTWRPGPPADLLINSPVFRTAVRSSPEQKAECKRQLKQAVTQM